MIIRALKPFRGPREIARKRDARNLAPSSGQKARWERQMVGISKGMAAVAAVVAFGLVTVDDFVGALAKSAPSLAQTEDATTDAAVVQEAALRERAAQALRDLIAKQGATRAEPESAGMATVAGPNCREQTWPYYSGACLVRGTESPVRTAIRVVAIERVAQSSARPASLH
jgi:hypothetical protein